MAAADMRFHLVILAALLALAASGPVPSEDPVDLVLAAPSLPPDLADPMPPFKHRRRVVPAVAPNQDVNLADGDPYRLPTNLRPVYYVIDLTPDLTKFTFSGDVSIVINCIEDTSEIVLHSKQLVIDQSSVVIYDLKAGSYEPYAGVSSLQYDTVHDFATLKLDTDLLKGGRYQLSMSFTGILNDDLDGFYRSSYKLATGETRWLATTQFESTGARRAFPCWDEPAFKARFAITITHDQGRSAVSNMPVVGQKDNGDGTITTSFDTTLPMSTYLVAFIVSDFASLTNAQKNFTVYARKDIISGGNFSQEIGQKALQLLADYNGIPYVLPKEDQAAIPDFSAGAMENWGLVTYREEYLITQDTQTIRIFEYTMTTICHELGHQWTGDLVTLDWWSHTWLNEGFADYFENYICNEINPDLKLRDKAVVADHHRAMEYDAVETQHAMSSPVSSPEEDESKFDRISYSKGGAVIRMWEKMLGIDVLKKGMNRYLSINMFKNTNPGHLFAAIDVEAHKAGVLPAGVSFKDIASSWTEQPGVPVVTVERDYDNNVASLDQERFFYSTPNRKALLEQRWHIPVTVVSQDSVDWDDDKPTAWLNPDIHDVTVRITANSSQWVLVNPKEIGYYRVNYDEDNWQLLTAAINADHTTFPGATRAQLVNDAMALARARKLGYTTALSIAKFLQAERDVAPWQAGVTALVYLRDKLSGTDAYPNFLSFLKQLTADAYKWVGYSGSTDHDVRYLRYYIVSYACFAGNEDCISSATSRLMSWLAGSGPKLDADTQLVTMCYGTRGADGDSNFAGLKKKWLAESDADTRLTLLQSLVCSQNQDLINGLLTDSISGSLNIDKAETTRLWTALLSRPEQVQLLFDFAKNNFKQIDQLMPSNNPSNSMAVQLLSRCINTINSPDKLTDARWWVEDNYKGQPGYDTLQSAFLQTYANLDWYSYSYEEVSDWLAANVQL